MKTTKYHIIFAICALMSAIMITGCANASFFPSGEHQDYTPTTPRLVVQGVVTDTASQPLQGITVAVYGVREENEPDAFSYNYTFTDENGQYMIVRYAGRNMPTEVTLVATDSAGLYAEQTLFATIILPGDTILINGWYPYPDKNYHVVADFTLQQQ